jgi:signal transduction histidine kinase/FixJ family two-component response regulator
VTALDLTRGLSASRLRALERVSGRELIQGGLFQVKLYNRVGRTVYSTKHNQIGLFDRGSGFQQALDGRASHTVSQIQTTSGGTKAGRKVLEAYVPFRLSPYGKIMGVFEVYQDYAPVAALANQEVAPLALALALALFALYLALFPLLRRLTRAIRERNQQLVEQADGLKEALTQKADAEAALQQTQKMDAVGRLAGGIAHDFNNLLLVIRGYTSLLLDGIGEQDPMRSDLTEIEKAADKATSLTGQLLTFSRRQPVHFKTFDLQEALEQSYGLLSRLIAEDIQVFLEESRDPCFVHADPGQLGQVIMNLAVNSRDAMPDGGTLRLKVQAVELEQGKGSLPAGRYVALSVKDTGHGMSEETKSRIFEPFYTTKDVGKGTGLGLAIAYGIVAQSGGQIDVVSELGKGTTFTIYLPPADATAVQLSEDHVAHRTLSKGNGSILLVEDEEAVRTLLAGTLKKQSYHVLEAADGEQALKVAQGYVGPIDLLLTDVVMPVMGGPELAAELCKLRPETRVLFMSGHPDRGQERARGVYSEGALADVEQFLQKPFEIPVLLEKLRETLDDEPAAQSSVHRSVPRAAER